jgi:hypothetical protein
MHDCVIRRRRFRIMMQQHAWMIRQRVIQMLLLQVLLLKVLMRDCVCVPHAYAGSSAPLLGERLRDQSRLAAGPGMLAGKPKESSSTAVATARTWSTPTAMDAGAWLKS